MATKRRFVRATSRCTDRSRWKEWLREGVLCFFFHTSYKYIISVIVIVIMSGQERKGGRRFEGKKGMMLTVLLDFYFTSFVFELF